MLLNLLLSLAVILPTVLCVSQTGSCQSPHVTSSYFIADDATFHFSTVFVVEFVLKCQNDAKDIPVYAEVNGRIIPASIASDSSRYQTSWTLEHEKADAGVYTVKLHTEDGVAAIRKAQRNNENIDKIAPLATISFDHKGSSKGPWVQSHMLAGLAALVIWYHAYSTKAVLLGN